MTASGYNEVISFQVNGNPYTITSGNLSPYPGICSLPFNAIASSGNLAFAGSTIIDAGTTIFIATGNISSVQVLGNAQMNGSVFNFYFANDTILQIQPFNDTVLCAHDTLKLPYTTLGQFATGNVHTLQLSNASGSFASPVAIGTLNGNAATGTINGIIPQGIQPGTGYRVRVVSTNPARIFASNTVNIKLGDRPLRPFTNNTIAICEPDTLFLTATGSATTMSYQWAGPGGFTASKKDTFIVNTATAMSGDYVVTTTSLHCSNTDTADVTIKLLPAKPNATGNSPLCEGVTLNLSSLSSTMGVSYNWAGPGGYTSNLASTSRTNVTPVMSGNYISTVTLNGCSNKDTAAITIYATPAAPTAGSNTPVCAGGDIKLTASTIPGATYEWTGPGSYFAGIQNPIRSGVAMTDGGTYSVLARVNGCPSAYGSTMVNVTAGPTVGLYPNPGDSICPGWDVTFVALPSGGGPSPTYEWFKNGNSTGATTPTYKATGVNDGDSFYVRMTAGTVCNTPINSKPMRITVLPTHTPPTISITATPGAHVWPGVEVVFKATAGNAGAHPGYQWRRNGADIPNAKNSELKADYLKTGDTICCIVTSNYLCAVPREVTSNCLVMNVDVGVEELGIRSKEQVYPNPNDGNFTIESIESGSVQISNMQGQLIGEYEIVQGKNRIALPVGTARGVYVVQLTGNPEWSGGNKVIGKVVVE